MARQSGKSKLTVSYRWAVPKGGALLHLFSSLNEQKSGVSMCAAVTFDPTRPVTFAFAPVCSRCRARGLPGHPLPRGLA